MSGLDPAGSCKSADSCVSKYVWKRINESISRTVDEIMLDQLVEESRKRQRNYRRQEMNKLIYLDNAATTKTSPEVVTAMLPYFTEHYGNPSSVYGFASANKEVITKQREIIAGVLGAKANEIYFTAGGTESDNWALTATAEAYAEKGKHIITSRIEHHAILHTCAYLEKRDMEVTYLDVDENGLVDPAAVEAAIRPDTILISIMFANNEIGTIEPIAEIGKIARAHGILFHTDAVQAFAHVPINVDECNIDMLSASGHKLNGPKGDRLPLYPEGRENPAFIHGGAQERKRRAGTENVPGIVGLGKAVELAEASMKARIIQETEIRDYLIGRIEKEIPYCRLNGDRTKRLPNNVNFSFRFIEGESLLIMLDMKGNLRVQRIRLHVRIPGSVPRAAGHRASP